MKDLSNYRKSYEKSELLENQIPEDPINLFHKWFYEAEDLNAAEEVNAMTVSTIGSDGFPKSRVVLLKKFNEEGFVFYTNYQSEKGKAIVQNPNVCLSFFWPTVERQIIIKGTAEQTTAQISDNYFASRPDGSKLGAIVSPQSEVIPNREFLAENLKELEKEWEGKEILRPNHWGGFLVRPVAVEFWQGRPNRLHDRIRYQLQANFEWKIERLAP
ncbi:pyridoxamine 5'-phosphate oxidase [Flavobacterium sp.]|jgi:pyridoxamine 5'-phosphate oxidase|uniref:pyridoxamine 5'-phosphate oxidase n=1 Tax=Flavobacterium sp. TaxID=239 RepID=UPI0037BE836F